MVQHLVINSRAELKAMLQFFRLDVSATRWKLGSSKKNAERQKQ